jgi:hypothetical protein
MNKIVIILVFIFTIISLNACKSTGSCVSNDNEEINHTQPKAISQTEVVS